jgi:hypothetical protein
MSAKQYCIVSGVLFALISIVHLLRIINGISIQVDQYAVPMTFSWVGFIVPGTLAFWAFRTCRPASPE